MELLTPFSGGGAGRMRILGWSSQKSMKVLEARGSCGFDRHRRKMNEQTASGLSSLEARGCWMVPPFAVHWVPPAACLLFGYVLRRNSPLRATLLDHSFGFAHLQRSDGVTLKR